MLREGLQRYLSPPQRKLLAAAKVGFAGTGGLGSNAAMLLARTGVEDFLLVDGDTVDASNLNRQHFFPRHLSMAKVDALAQLLWELNPDVKVDKRRLWLDRDNTPSLLAEAPIWVEALDDPYMKRDFVEQALQAGVFVVSASGLAGWGGSTMQTRRMGDRLVLVGDFVSSIDRHPPLAPRVMQAAAMQADAVLEHILGSCVSLADEAEASCNLHSV